MSEADQLTTGTEKGAVKPQAAMRWNDPPARSARESFGAVPVAPVWDTSILYGSHRRVVTRRSFGQNFSFDAGRFEIDGDAPHLDELTEPSGQL